MSPDDHRFLSVLASVNAQPFSTRDLAALIGCHELVRDALPADLAARVGSSTFAVVLGRALAKRVDARCGIRDDVRLVRAGVDRTRTQFWRVLVGTACRCDRPMPVLGDGDVCCGKCGRTAAL